MYRQLFCITILLAALTANAQDTLISFLDKDYKQVEQDEAFYVRVVLSHNNQVRIIDATLDNKVSAYSEYRMDPQLILHGQSVYYSEPGKIYSSGYYRDGMMVGEWKYHPEAGSDSIVTVDYDQAHEYLDATDCKRMMRRARNIDHRTGISETDLSLDIKNHIESNVIVPGRFVNEHLFRSFVLTVIIDTDGRIKCPLFTQDFEEQDIGMEILRALSTYRYKNTLAYPVKLDVFCEFSTMIIADSIIAGVAPEFDVDPEFPGGKTALMNYLASNLNYPAEARNAGKQGTVYLAFTIGIDGRIRDIDVLRGVHPSLDREAQRVIENSPPWIPAVLDGQPVEVRYNMPIRFIMN